MAACALVASCVDVDKQVGENLIPGNQDYVFYTTEFDLDDIKLAQADSLSGYDFYRITIGSIRDNGTFGLTRKSSAFYLCPVVDTIDYGEPGTQQFIKFHISAPHDTTSYERSDQAYILQNINVYALDEPMDTKKGVPELVYDKTKRISKNIPVYNGVDSLSIDLTAEYGQKYLTITQEELDDLSLYLKRFPGIVLSTDDPIGEGGRINMFRLPIDVTSSSITGSYATLYFSAVYEGARKDTSFVFYLGPAEKYDFEDVTDTNVSTYPQYAFNYSEHSSKELEGDADDVLLFEGGRGIKPVIKASAIRERLAAEVIAKGGNPKSVVINKASLDLPFEMPEDYLELDYYPTTMSPTCRVENSDGRVSFVGITDNSISSEDPGTINRSLLTYTPDITYHVQQLLRLEDESKINNYDIWFLALANEEITTTSTTSSEMSDYYMQLAYSSYYNSMYGAGYGSSYGYNSYYNNYYNYMMMASMMNTSSTTTETQSLMDCNRYYRGILNGPAASRHPKITVIYAIPSED